MTRPLLFLLALGGCGYVDDDWFDANVRDVDGDGIVSERFASAGAAFDCDDLDPDVQDCDVDRDGFRSSAVGGTDCDDGDAAVNPEATERCNGFDDDCDGQIDGDDDAVAGTVDHFADEDGDGFGAGAARPFCPDDVPAGWSTSSVDCDDSVATTYPGATEFCDEIDQDCDGQTFDPDANDAVAQRRVDEDEDGFPGPAILGPGCVMIGQVNAAVGVADDCNDTDASTFPGADEVWYDGVDQACDGGDDFDRDGDGFTNETDCDDTDSAVFPGATELCDGIDNDCDTFIDDADALVQDPDNLFWRDADGDGWGDPGLARGFCSGIAPAGYVAQQPGFADCDDALPGVYPTASETCDGVDNDCNGLVDDGAIDATNFFIDSDGDGFGSLTTLACFVSDGVVAIAGDCDDRPIDGASVYPGAQEVCGDGILQDCSNPVRRFDCDLDGQNDASFDVQGVTGTDCNDGVATVYLGAPEICDGLDNDCNGQTDEEAIDADILFRDADGDGFGDEPVPVCGTPAGFVSIEGDCDDTASSIRPGAAEVCGDGILQDCSTPARRYDCDLDGSNDQDYVVNGVQGTDCDDTKQTVNPSAPEICDGIDNDCDDQIDDADPDVDTENLPDWYADIDGDGFGSNTLLIAQTCAGPAGGVPNANDCNDADATVNPEAPEICDGKDNDCDLAVDTGALTNPPTFWFDNDADGFGGAVPSNVSCEPLSAEWVASSGDCDDVADTVFPGAIEVCDGADNDCDGLFDDADSATADPDGLRDFLVWYLDTDGDDIGEIGVILRQCAQPTGYTAVAGDCDNQDPTVVAGQVWYRDGDGDGFGDAGQSVEQCGQPIGYVNLANDCDDANPQVSPAAPETCDDVDNDCDGLIDDADSLVSGAPVWYADNDNDLYGRGSLGRSCEPPVSVSSSPFQGDCDDNDQAVNPAAVERCNQIDDDCDGFADDEDLDGSVIGQTQWYTDEDGDGFVGTPYPLLQCDVDGGELVSTDCDDQAQEVFPGQVETCNGGVDDDCNGSADEEDVATVDVLVRFRDDDGDGFGVSELAEVTCDEITGYVAADGDCDDDNTAVKPGVVEVCDGIDNNCVAGIDEELRFDKYEDVDEDGFGVEPSLGVFCLDDRPDLVNMAGDCNDADAAIHPDAEEVCDYVDNNCIDGADEGVQAQLFWDSDGDGLGGSSGFLGCPDDYPSYVQNDDDCYDYDPQILEARYWYLDNDNDTFGDPDTLQYVCDAPTTQYVEEGTDCDDEDANVYGWTAAWFDGDGDGYGDPSTEMGFCQGVPSDYVPNDGDCNPDNPSVPKLSNQWTVDSNLAVPADFRTLEEALQEVCAAFEATIDIAAGDYVMPAPETIRADRLRLTGVATELTRVTGSFPTDRALELDLGNLSIEVTQRPFARLTGYPYLDKIRIDAPSGTGPVFTLEDSASMDFRDSTALIHGGSLAADSGEDEDFSSNRVSIRGSEVRGTGDLGPLASTYVLSVEYSVIAGLWDALPGPSTASFSGPRQSTIATFGLNRPPFNYLLPYDSVIEAELGRCSDAGENVYTNLETCSAQGVRPTGLQSWHINLPEPMWDLHLNIDSDAFAAGVGVANGPFYPGYPLHYGDYSPDTEGFPQYWQPLHAVDCATGAGEDDDGLDCATEYAMGTSPSHADTDGDGVNDDVDTAPLDSLTP